MGGKKESRHSKPKTSKQNLVQDALTDAQRKLHHHLLFYSLQRAAFTDVRTCPAQEVQVQVPCFTSADSKQLFRNEVLRQLLFKPLSDFLAPATTTTTEERTKTETAGGMSDSQVSSEALIVHIDLESMKPVPHSAVTIAAAADTSSTPSSHPPLHNNNNNNNHTSHRKESNPSMVQLRITIDVTVARVAYGMVAGKALCSPTIGYVEVAVPTQAADPSLASALTHRNESKKKAEKGKRERENADEAEDAEAHPTTGGAVRLMACYQPQEGCLLAGEAVMVVAEPGALCAIAVRVPRPARGTFDLVGDELLGKKQWKCVRYTRAEEQPKAEQPKEAEATEVKQ